MATIIPFRGIVYNLSKAGSISNLVCPPYDIISQAEQQELYRKSPYNIIRLEYGLESPGDTEGDNRYIRAAALLDDWFKTDILHQSQDPAIYIYEMEYAEGSTLKKLRGLVCLVRIEDYDSGIVKPHETTLSGPKTDRLNLLRACKASFSQIFSLFSDPAGKGLRHPRENELEARNGSEEQRRSFAPNVVTDRQKGYRGHCPGNGGQALFHCRRSSSLRYGA